jgi:hypothetical protein
MSANIEYAKANPEKMMVLRAYAKGNPADMMNLLVFIRLPMDTFRSICQMKGSDWSNYGGLKETEYYFNRNEEDIPIEKRKSEYTEEDREVLTKELFEKFNDRTAFTYELYLTMRDADDKYYH